MVMVAAQAEPAADASVMARLVKAMVPSTLFTKVPLPARISRPPQKPSAISPRTRPCRPPPPPPPPFPLPSSLHHPFSLSYAFHLQFARQVRLISIVEGSSFLLFVDQRVERMVSGAPSMGRKMRTWSQAARLQGSRVLLTMKCPFPRRV